MENVKAGSLGGLSIIPLLYLCSQTVKKSACFPVHVIKYENDKSRDLQTPASHAFRVNSCFYVTPELAIRSNFHLMAQQELLII